MTTHVVDPTLAVGVVSVLTAIVTTVGGIAVAIINSRREATNAAISAADAATDEANAARLTLRDEQIAALEWKVRNREARIVQLETELATLRAQRNQEMRGPHDAAD